MPIAPNSAAERQRVSARVHGSLAPTRALGRLTRDKRHQYLTRFKCWLWEEKGVSFRFLMEQKPADPERIFALLIEYGRQLYYAGKAYGIYAETINAVACSRPLIKRSLTAAWDLAFAWLCDEPCDHHPAMPLTVLAAMSVVSLTWGWPHVWMGKSHAYRRSLGCLAARACASRRLCTRHLLCFDHDQDA